MMKKEYEIQFVFTKLRIPYSWANVIESVSAQCRLVYCYTILHRISFGINHPLLSDNGTKCFKLNQGH